MTTGSGTCDACAFFDEHRAVASSGNDGLCRFNPPVSQPTAEARGLWPVVSEKDWCGHFAPETAGAAVAAA